MGNLFQSTEIVKDGNIYNKVDVRVTGKNMQSLILYVNGNGSNGTSWVNANLNFNDDYTIAIANDVVLTNPTSAGIVYRMVADMYAECTVYDVQIKYKE